MASAFARYEDETLRKVLAVSLDAAGAQTGVSPPVVVLTELAEELRAEVGADGGPLLLSSDTVERVLMARLSSPPAAYPQWPVHYLLGCYARASGGWLAVSYTGLTLSLDMFPQPPEAQQRGALQLLDALDAAAAAAAAGGLAGPAAPGGGGASGAPPPGGAVPMPPGFLEDYAARFEEEGLEGAVEPMAHP
eukprot:scaffold2.g7091.t1